MKNTTLLFAFLISMSSLYGQGFLVPIDTITNNIIGNFSGNVVDLSNEKLFYSNGSFAGGTGSLYTLERNGELVSKANPQAFLGQYLYVLPDDSYIILGAGDLSAGTTSQIFATRFDASNTQVWTNTYTEVSSSSYVNIIQGVIVLEDGFMVYGGNIMNTTDPASDDERSPFMFKIDRDGNLIWEISLETSGFFETIYRHELSRSSKQSPIPAFEHVNIPGLDTISFVTRSREYAIDTDGNIISNIQFKEYELFDDLDYGSFENSQVQELKYAKLKVDDGEIVLSTVFVSYEEYDPIKDEYIFTGFEKNYISKFSNDTRDRLWLVKTDALFNGSAGGSLTSTGHISLLPNGNIMYIPTSTRTGKIQEYDTSNGDLVNEKPFENTNNFMEVFETFPKDGYVMCAASTDFTSPDEKIQFFKVNDNLETYDFETTNIPAGDHLSLKLVKELPNNEFAGFVSLRRNFTEVDLFAFRTDSNGVIYSNEINGNVIGDLSNDCEIDSLDVDLSNWEVVATGDKFFRTTSNTDGSYILQVDTGEYQVSVIPKNDFWLNCDTTDIEFATFFDTLSNINLVTSAITPCSFIEIDVGFGWLRRCFSNKVVVQYCNQGTFAEEEAMVELHLDPFLDVDTTSIPITSQIDTTLFFDIGAVGIGECGSFTIHVTPNCENTFLGQEHCINAHVFPDTLCVPQDSLWSGANVVVEAICLGDSVLFNIINDGLVPTKDDLAYIVIVDDIIVARTGAFSLQAGESITFIEFQPGATIRLIADQEPFHPLGNQVGVEAFCAGTDFDFISEFNQFDDDPFTDIVCVNNMGSFDPNDKAAIPMGLGPEHFIPATQELEYKIRFQNTGTDTAFTVVIRDTLSSRLDMSTFETGIGSHDYILDVEEENILVFTFNDILLPDSTINWTESNGFVEFKISPVSNVVPDDMIENTAAIFFDFNEPVITNTVFHTIETPLVFSILDIDLCANNTYNTSYYFADTAVSEFFYSDLMDSISIVNIKVLPVDSMQEFYTLPYGSLYDGIALTSDTVIIDSYTNSFGCDSILVRNIMVERTNAISLLDESNWSIFPNPTKGLLSISTNQFFSQSTYRIHLLSIIGTTVYDRQHEIQPGRVLDLSLQGLSAGTYLLIIESEHGSIIEKVIVQP